jgi:heme exporter protein D
MSWSEFFSMGGYAGYVWGSYAVALIAMGGEVIFLLRRRKTLTQQRESLDHSSAGETHEN